MQKLDAVISDFRDVFYTRDYRYDTPEPMPGCSKARRCLLAAIPFLSLHPSCQLPIALVMGTTRAWTCYNEKEVSGTSMAILAVAGSVFQFRIGILATVAHDIFLELKHVKQEQCDGEEIAKSSVKIMNHLLFLGLTCRGGLELSILSLAMQAVVNASDAREDFKKGLYIEGTANLLMAGVRSGQSYRQFQHLQRRWEIERAMQNVFVGELHEKWQFPSDHLPVAVEIDGKKVISWNVMNSAYMEWVVEKDSQGLNGSMLTDLDIPVGSNGLTQRDVLIADMVQQMSQNGEVIALQECSLPFLEHLEGKLGASWGMVRSFEGNRVDQEVVLYHRDHFSYLPECSETSSQVYPSFPGRPVQRVSLEGAEGSIFQVINTHIPGDPNLPGREEVARYAERYHRDDRVTIVLGDNNFERHEMLDAFFKAGFSNFSLHSPWKTNIDPYSKESKGIDHFFVIGHKTSVDLRPEDFLPGDERLPQTIALLDGKEVREKPETPPKRKPILPGRTDERERRKPFST